MCAYVCIPTYVCIFTQFQALFCVSCRKTLQLPVLSEKYNTVRRHKHTCQQIKPPPPSPHIYTDMRVYRSIHIYTYTHIQNGIYRTSLQDAYEALFVQYILYFDSSHKQLCLFIHILYIYSSHKQLCLFIHILYIYSSHKQLCLFIHILYIYSSHKQLVSFCSISIVTMLKHIHAHMYAHSHTHVTSSADIRRSPSPLSMRNVIMSK
jgi:hypothetical protein